MYIGVFTVKLAGLTRPIKEPIPQELLQELTKHLHPVPASMSMTDAVRNGPVSNESAAQQGADAEGDTDMKDSEQKDQSNRRDADAEGDGDAEMKQPPEEKENNRFHFNTVVVCMGLDPLNKLKQNMNIVHFLGTSSPAPVQRRVMENTDYAKGSPLYVGQAVQMSAPRGSVTIHTNSILHCVAPFAKSCHRTNLYAEITLTRNWKSWKGNENLKTIGQRFTTLNKDKYRRLGQQQRDLDLRFDPIKTAKEWRKYQIENRPNLGALCHYGAFLHSSQLLKAQGQLMSDEDFKYMKAHQSVCIKREEMQYKDWSSEDEEEVESSTENEDDDSKKEQTAPPTKGRAKRNGRRVLSESARNKAEAD